MAKLPDATALGERPTPAAVGARTSYQYKSGAEFAEGNAMNELGKTFQHIDKEIERQEDQFARLRAEDAFNKLREAQLDLTSGDNGFTKAKGADAVNRDLQKEYGQQFQDKQRAILEGLKGPKDKAYFQQRASVSGLQFKQDLLNHVTQQADVYAKDVFKSGLDVELSNAIARYKDPNGIALSLTRMNGLIDQEADRAGWSPDAIKAAKSEAMSKAHMGVISNHLADDNDITASAYFASVKDQIKGQDLDNVKKMLDEGSTRGKAYRASDGAIAKYPNDLKKQLDSVKGLPPKQRALATQLIKEEAAVKDRIEKEQEDHAMTSAIQVVLDGGGTRQIPANVRVRLGDAGNAAIDKLLAERSSGVEPKTDPKKMTEFDVVLRDKTRLAAMSDMDFYSKYWINFSNDDRKYATEMREAAINAVKGDKTAVDKHASTLQFDDIVNGYARQYGVLPRGKTPKDMTDEESAKYANFRKVADKAVKDFERTLAGKRGATSEEMEQAISKELSRKVFVSEWGTDPEKPLAALGEKERRKAYVPYEQIPPTFISNVVNRAKSEGMRIMDKSGKEVNRDKIQRAYAAALMGDDALLMQILGE